MIARPKSAKKKLRTCRVCKCKFAPARSIQPTCDSFECKLTYATRHAEKIAAIRAKERRNDAKKEKESLKTRREWLNEAQAAVNAYVRMRDKDLPCISCGRFHQGQYHAGHYLSRGAHPELALNPINIAKQCAPCNTHLSGNQVRFRTGLIARIGIELVEWLEGPHEPKRYTIEDAKRIRDEFRSKLKELEKVCL